MASPALTLLLLISLQTLGTSTESVVAVDRSLWDSNRTGDTCKDCTHTLELVADLFSQKELQEKLVKGVQVLCERIPASRSAVILCKEEVKRVIPAVIDFLTHGTKPAETCQKLGLCQTFDARLFGDFVKDALDTAAILNDPRRNACSFCLFLMRTLEGLLPKQRTEDAVVRLLEDICHILPSSQQQQCEDVVGKFSKTVIDAILSYATPRSICELLRLCRSYEETLDPCSEEAFRCRDFGSALRCGTVFYCQRFAWKRVNV
ncbi:unnamed protein product [Knipowitschia caucasica]|uniref:Uncharacterized protein n=1 Tax=Knipowitschia caucasica TaxID=637954 RepID=A0AAV2J2D2_KNICA